ncbi:Crp/Fnr family transcriptional regulator [Thiothrix winogradskyi]|uniref:Crp/Fnr family transcriptional regulator n=1 Tax=Thiothrix winogradskyi TaxID=96472 RepID=A0ABY3T6F4_9GAMM|nr:Crp/Fnr family transcriptional regulator [Thiothrix winogradskyi]UJS26390.1 Crp/Fnr family transcriptional regulator [Thiothrix winogradskyi]
MTDKPETLLPGYFPPCLTQQAKVQELQAGECLFRINDTVDGLFYLQSGEVKAVRYLSDGTEVIMLRTRPGELLGESTMAVERYVCDAVVLSDCRVTKIPMQALKQELATNPDFAFQLMLAIARTSRLQCSRYERLRLKNAADRVLHYLLCESGGSGTIEYPSHLYEWAHELGLQRETLYRTLAALEKAGKISRTERTIHLLG